MSPVFRFLDEDEMQRLNRRICYTPYLTSRHQELMSGIASKVLRVGINRIEWTNRVQPSSMNYRISGIISIRKR